MTGLCFTDNSVCGFTGEIKRLTPAAVLVDSDEYGEVWIPKRVITDWWFVKTGDKKHLKLDDWEEGDYLYLCVKKWFCRKEGIV